MIAELIRSGIQIVKTSFVTESEAKRVERFLGPSYMTQRKVNELKVKTGKDWKQIEKELSAGKIK